MAGCVNDSLQINNVLVDHFSNLWNNPEIQSLEWYLDALPSNLPTLNNDQQAFLSRHVSKDEIYKTLLALSEGKSPGPDGFNVEFYKIFWNDIEASRKSARNISLRLNIYAHISGQFPNQTKSEIYVPSWFNHQVSSRISGILNFKIGKTPFTYLGVLISPKKLVIAHFDSMINRINKSIVVWRKANLSKAGKSILINSILMVVPIYYLSVYPIPETVLFKFSKLARKFLWANHEQDSGMSVVNWDIITASKSEGGLGIRNLIKDCSV
ncbi:uncharacterized protein LOC120270234 [Dioscorea cayenensis subsp. rotundata]|uniref:Uncharacterized protein LOC120270234 n=1 Tax=Dioscorea cayennensis subsp. rotundata TaxID=55577 RepID=A0AB40C0A6_DIOCR|nr:uncharacterized protein LOC120270234 [Dioscorea cayenensis subsp. rotundata]